MEHPLDNPIYNALNSGNKNLSAGNEFVKYFSKDVSPFAGFKGSTAAGLDQLYNMVPSQRTLAVFTPEEISISNQWNLINHMNVLQMVYHHPAPNDVTDEELIPLEEQHIPAMLDLTKLTNPGPFLQRTIEFGHYEGVFKGNELVAMSGQRLNPCPYAEISAVCTHPDHLGNGYASQLLKSQIRQIIAKSEIPFLHVRKDNTTAIKVYERIGFVNRRDMVINVIQKY